MPLGRRGSAERLATSVMGARLLADGDPPTVPTAGTVLGESSIDLAGLDTGVANFPLTLPEIPDTPVSTKTTR